MMQLEFAKAIPEAWRLLRSSLRPRRIQGLAALSFAVMLLFLVFTIVILGVERPGLGGWPPAKEVMESFYPITIVLLSIVWFVGVPSMIGNSVSTELSERTWVFQLTSPQPLHRLLLGKLLGTAGEAYVVFACVFPISILSGLGAGYSIFLQLKVLAVILGGALLLSCVMLLVSCMSEKKKTMPFSLAVLIMLLLVLSSIMLTMEPAYFIHYSAVLLHPVVLVVNLLGLDPTLYGQEPTPLYVFFFGAKFPAVIFSLFFYLVWSLCFFLSAVANINRKSGYHVSRLPLLGIMFLGDFFIVGLTSDSMYPDETLIAITCINCFFVYSAMLTHTRPVNDIRPWVYRRRTPEWKFLDYFKSDAPFLFTAIPLVIFQSAALMAMVFSNYCCLTSLAYPFLYMVMFLTLVVRDSLFLQMAQFRWKRGLTVAFVIYLISFVGFSIIHAIDTKGNGYYIDLTPLSSFLPFWMFKWFAASCYNSTIATYIITAAGINLVISALFSVPVFKTLSKINEGFREGHGEKGKTGDAVQ